MIDAHKILIRNSEGKETFGSGSRCKDNVKIYVIDLYIYIKDLYYKSIMSENIIVLIKNKLKKTAKKRNQKKKKKSKDISVTGRGGLWDCEVLRIPHCLDNRLTVNCEILATCSSTYTPVRTSQEAHSVSIK
jgi:hypothetical protein